MRLEPNQPLTLDDPLLSIDAGLAPGAHRFQLVVLGGSGLRSQPAEVVVVIVDPATSSGDPSDPF